MNMQQTEQNQTDCDVELFSHVMESIRPYIKSTDILDIDNKSMTFSFYDPMLGIRKMRAYAHQGAAVLTCWEDNYESVAYIHDAMREYNFEAFVKLAKSYLTDPFKFYEKPMLECWQSVEAGLGEFVKKYGAEVLTSKILKVPFMDEDTKVKLLSYLTLEGEIRKAREREAKIEIARKYVPQTSECRSTRSYESKDHE